MVPDSHNLYNEYNVWAHCFEEKITLYILLPNAVIIPLEVNKNSSLSQLKACVFEEAQLYPCYGALRDINSYVFVCVKQTTAVQEEILEEQTKISVVKPFQGILKLVERQGDKADKVRKIAIGSLIGKGLHEFDSLKNPEVNDFRYKMRIFSEEIAEKRNQKSWIERMLYQYPLRLEGGTKPPASFMERLLNGKIMLSLHAEGENKERFTFFTSHETTPVELMKQIFTKKGYMGEESLLKGYILKVLGREEFIVGEYPLSQFKYIRDMVSNHKNPTLVLFPKFSIELDCEDHYESLEKLEPKRTSFYGNSTTLKKSVSSWSITVPFSVKINQCCKLNCPDSTKVIVKVGLFHGGESLCEILSTGEAFVVEGECLWEEAMVFDINVCNLPRMTRLCITVGEINRNNKGHKAKKSKQHQDSYSRLGWVNTTVFDFKNTLKSGAMTLHLWPFSESCQTEEMLNPLGTIVSNPNTETAPAILLTFGKFLEGGNVCYPAFETVLENAQISVPDNESKTKMHHASKFHLEQVREICDRDPLHQMHEQEKELLWFLRLDCCCSLPNSLPKLLKSVKWSDPSDVSQITLLLQKWPKLEPEKALELLDYAYADQSVRTFAVNCLKSMSDEKLSLYLLQLVQALKHESYLYSDLVKFLLYRALNNQHIGQALFWLLRSEMHNPSVSVLYGVILEVYCYGSPNHMKVLQKQVSSLTQLKALSETLNDECNKHKEARERKQVMHSLLAEEQFENTIQNLLNPLDPSQKIRAIKIEKCRFMDSKMKPLWLVFENIDSEAEDVMFMFKNGDDLRQDMLTLQMIRIMDSMWKEEGLDFRMLPYLCIATSNKLGLIEIVRESTTIANIQIAKGFFTATSAFKKGSLLTWLKEQNPTEASLNRAIEEFTLSCVGYCVATYVLGIADRHSDNIMIKENGQMFHIDFGHILGNFKEKFGIRRERVPFVLTNDFVFVITGGHTERSEAFTRFQRFCEQAFMILRRKGPLIISLFGMMISTGMPELTCEKDLAYLQETLVLDHSESDALNHFRIKFLEAFRNSWKTSVNWCIKALAKDKKIGT